MLIFGWICSRGYGVIGVLSSWGLVTPKFSAPPSGETMRQTPKVLEVQERARGPLSPCQVWWGSDFPSPSLYFIFPRRLTSASALPRETGNPEIAAFHLNAACFFTIKTRNR